MKKCLLLSTCIFLVNIASVWGQNYKTGVGLRLWSDAEISIKHFVSGAVAVEGIIELRRKAVGTTLLFEKHATAFDVPELQWYYGLGGHIGFWQEANDNRPVFSEDSEMVAGVSGIVGLEYTIKEIPFSISVDYKPLVHLIGYDGLINTGALTIRYVF
ncbi:MAG: hypothetical protein SF052_16980 [Bacteroidia bacterium]|nr:hypothetical protein [Bacteroidia bacterium]